MEYVRNSNCFLHDIIAVRVEFVFFCHETLHVHVASVHTELASLLSCLYKAPIIMCMICLCTCTVLNVLITCSIHLYLTVLCSVIYAQIVCIMCCSCNVSIWETFI